MIDHPIPRAPGEDRAKALAELYVAGPPRRAAHGFVDGDSDAASDLRGTVQRLQAVLIDRLPAREYVALCQELGLDPEAAL
jgi:hypothetical protein